MLLAKQRRQRQQQPARSQVSASSQAFRNIKRLRRQYRRLVSSVSGHTSLHNNEYIIPPTKTKPPHASQKGQSMYHIPKTRSSLQDKHLGASYQTDIEVWSERDSLDVRSRGNSSTTSTPVTGRRRRRVISNEDVLLHNHPNPRTGEMSPYIINDPTASALEKLDYFSIGKDRKGRSRQLSTVRTCMRGAKDPILKGIDEPTHLSAETTNFDIPVALEIPATQNSAENQDAIRSSVPHGFNAGLESYFLPKVHAILLHTAQIIRRIPAIFRILRTPVTDLRKTLGALIDIIVLSGLCIALFKGRTLLLEMVEYMYLTFGVIIMTFAMLIGWSLSRTGPKSIHCITAEPHSRSPAQRRCCYALQSH